MKGQRIPVPRNPQRAPPYNLECKLKVGSDVEVWYGTVEERVRDGEKEIDIFIPKRMIERLPKNFIIPVTFKSN